MTTDQEFRQVADLLPELMLLVAGAHILSCNSAFSSALGVPRSELIGQPLAALVTDSEIGPYLRRCAMSGQLVLGALTFRRSDGTTIPCRSEGARYRHAESGTTVLLRCIRHESSVARFVALTQKIGELTGEVGRRKRAESGLTEQREWLRVTLSSIGDGVIATDPVGRIVFMNTVAERLTGWRGAEASGRPIAEIFNIVNEQTRQPVVNPVITVLAEGRIVGLANHTVLVARDGTERAIDDSGAPIAGADGRVLGVVLVFRDATETRAAARSERAAHEAAEAANRAKDEFLAMLGHELRNPLAPIVTALQLARLKGNQPSREFDVIERQVGHLLRLVDDLLDIARVTRGNIELRREVVDVAQLLARAVEIASPVIDARGHRLEMSTQPDLLIDADPTRMSQVFANLLTNAAKYTPNGGCIRVTAAAMSDDLVVTVRDNGIGIPEDLQPHVFDLFVQGSRTRDRHEGGLGIGLALVKNLVSLHHGEVSVSSDGPGAGSTFHVRLPRSTRASMMRSKQAFEPRTKLATMRVVVVDDNGEAAELIAEVLRIAGCQVTVCTDPVAALHTAERLQPDVMVLDIGLPVVDGYELAAAIRGRCRGPSPRFIALTGYGQEHDRERSAAAGFDAHLVKPIDNEALLDAIASAGRP